MLDKKEKLVMKYLSQICTTKNAYLISTSSIAEFVSRKYIITIAELDEMMTNLVSENYLEYIVSNSKNGYYYVINLKVKGLVFSKDLQKEKRALVNLVIRTFLLAIFSFVVGLILKAIF